MKLIPYTYGFEIEETRGTGREINETTGRRENAFHLNDRALRQFRVHVKRSEENNPAYKPYIPAVKGGPIPTHLFAVSLGGLSSRIIDLADLEHIRTVNGGIVYRDADKRPGGGVCRRSHTMGMWFSPRNYGSNGDYGGTIVFARTHGGGTKFYSLSSYNADQTYLNLAKVLDDNDFWNVVNTITCDAYDDGRNAGRAESATEYKQAFVNGWLKKRKIRGTDSYKVEIKKPLNLTSGPDGVTRVQIDLVDGEITCLT